MALDVFLSIPGIPGESTDTGFQGTIVTQSYGWALEHGAPLSSSNQGGKTTFQPLTIQKNVDSASLLLMQSLALGKRIASMTLLVTRTSGNAANTAPFLIYDFQDVFVSSVIDGGGSGDTPTESVTFVFGVYQLRYRKTDNRGMLSSTAATSAWSVLTNSVPGGPAPH